METERRPYRRTGWPAGPCVYVCVKVNLFGPDGPWKIGSTSNLRRRLREHGHPQRLVSFRECDSVDEARRVEMGLHKRMRWGRHAREWYWPPR